MPHSPYPAYCRHIGAHPKSPAKPVQQNQPKTSFHCTLQKPHVFSIRQQIIKTKYHPHPQPSKNSQNTNTTKNTTQQKTCTKKTTTTTKQEKK
jgi:hypothetical protein